MGSTGKARGITATALPPIPPTPVNAQVQQQNQNIQNQPPTPQNTPVQPGALDALTQMTDSQLAALVQQARSASLPNFLADSHDLTQQFVFVAGLNEKPLVLDDAQFQQFLTDNNIPRSDILTRSINSASYRNAGNNTVSLSSNQIFDMLKYSRLNYIGGKQGGQVYGAGTYLARTGGNSQTGYGGTSNDAVLNPQYARPITMSALRTQALAFDRTHPQFARAVGGFSSKTASVYALVMGHNVITDMSGRNADYHNVIDRRALVWKKSTY